MIEHSILLRGGTEIVDIRQKRGTPMSLPRNAIYSRLLDSDLPPATAAKCLRVYEMFIEFVREHPNKMIAPPFAADMAWHEHLEMESYARDCVELCGREIVHNADLFDTKEFWEAWEFSRELFGKRGVRLPGQHDDWKDSDLRPHTCSVFAA